MGAVPGGSPPRTGARSSPAPLEGVTGESVENEPVVPPAGRPVNAG